MRNNVYSFSVVNMEDIDEDEFNSSPDKSIFTTKEWIGFIEEDAKAKPIIVRITKDNKFIGYFSGLVFKKFGIRMVGSPFEGWSTCFMGLDLNEEEDRLAIYSELCTFLYKKCKCVYIEINDRFVDLEKANSRGVTTIPVDTLEVEIDKTDEGLFKIFKTDCRNFIRQFERRGASIEIAEPNDEFAEEYYRQIEDVFAKQGLVPTYSVEKVKCLLHHMKDTDKVLCLQVRNPEGKSIATSIFFGYKERFFFWAGASYRPEQHYRPNEYMIWTAIKYWRDRGCKTFDMVGVRDYKKKFGSHQETYTKLVFTKYKLLLFLRNQAKKAYFLMLKLKGFVGRKK